MQHINVKGNLLRMDKPTVMGILNVTPDSFYAESRMQTEENIHQRIQQILDEGGTYVDVGGYSSRPNATEVSAKEEMNRLSLALKILQTHYPKAIVSVDTFRAEIAKEAVEIYGASIINDISGGDLDEKMFETIATLGVPYIIMHMRGTPQAMQKYCNYENIIVDLLKHFAQKLEHLYLMGVNDVIVDPGFGFSKTIDQNYLLMSKLKQFKLLDTPLLVGVSRKSMIYKLLGKDASESLNGSTALHCYALLNGANILRVHDVAEAVETIKIVEKLQSFSNQ